MPQIRLYLDAPHKKALQLSQALESSFEDEGFPVAAFESNEERQLWTVSVYCAEESRQQVCQTVETAAARFGIPHQIGEELLPDENWVEKTLQDLAPVRAGRFVIHGSHDTGVVKPHEFGILIDAAMAFGTGHHGTTAGCLTMLDRLMKRRRYGNALDLGAGTGVLAIAIAKMAHIPVLATDIDPVAAQTTAGNARRNGVSPTLDAVTARGFAHREIAARAPYDLIVANILAGPLQAMAHQLAHHLAANGTVILSGLLPHQRARITAAYRLQGLRFARAHCQDGWLTMEFHRP